MLQRLARNLPACVTSDHLTLLGLAGALVAGLGFLASSVVPWMLAVACLGLALNWLGDSLDGTLARLRGAERPQYGFFVDHSTDVLSQALIFLGLGLSVYMRFDAACLALMGYWMAALYTFIRALATRVFQISYLGVGPTEVRLGLILYTGLAMAVGPMTMRTPLGPATPIDIIAVAAFGFVFVAFGAMAWAEGRRLASREGTQDAAWPREQQPATWSLSASD